MSSVATAGGMAIALYMLGVVSNKVFGWPGPVVMLLLAVIVAISIAMTPWGEIVTSFHWTNIVTAVATVLTITGVGFVVGG